MALPMNDTVFAVFELIGKKFLINYVMTNKMAQNERISPVKHNHIIQDKF